MEIKSEYKAPGGLIRITATVQNDTIDKIKITGDFFMFPEESLEELENSLKGVKMGTNILQRILEEFLKKNNILMSLTLSDIVTAIMHAKSASQKV